jgi:hypothetical protein
VDCLREKGEDAKSPGDAALAVACPLQPFFVDMLATRRRLVVSKLVKSHDFVRRRAPCLALPLVCCASTHAPELVYVVVWRGGGGVVVVVKQGLQRKVGVVVG